MRGIWILVLNATLMTTACKFGGGDSGASRIKSDTPAGDEGGGKRKERVAKARRANRIFQVYLDRELGKDKELTDNLSLTPADLKAKLAAGDEARTVLAARLARFLKEHGAEPRADANVTLAMAPQQLVPDEGQPVAGANGARLCGEVADNGLCFTRWLVDTVAPGLAGVWAQTELTQIASKPYGEILAIVADKSLEF